MKRALALVLVVAGCGTETNPDTGRVEQAIVEEPQLEDIAMDIADLAAQCFELPEDLSVQWIRDRLIYNRSCFDSWTVQIDIACPIGDWYAEGNVLVAGPNMAKLPEKGFLIRARAALSALADLAAAANGDIWPRLDGAVEGPGLSLRGCAAPRSGGLHGDLELVADVPVLGVIDVAGSADVTRDDDLYYIDYLAAISAEPPGGPVVSGELAGTGIERNKGDLCPQAGEITFTGSIGETTAEVALSFVGDGAGLITLDNGETIGPHAAPRCDQ